MRKDATKCVGKYIELDKEKNYLHVVGAKNVFKVGLFFLKHILNLALLVEALDKTFPGRV